MNTPKQQWSLREIASFLDAKVIGDPDYFIDSLAPLDTAKPHQLSFYHNSRYHAQLQSTQAGAILMNEKEIAGMNKNLVVVSSPYLAFAKLTALMRPRVERSAFIAASSHIAPSAKIHPSAYIGHNVVIGEDAELEENVVIEANCVVSNRVKIKKGTTLYPNVVLYDDVCIGQFSILHSGVVIGSDGFGYAPSREGWCKIYHLGRVVIGDNVEIGANTTIDRGVLNDTVIADGVKLDNQIQVGHNVRIGKNTVIAGCTGIAGSTVIGENCLIGGAVGITGHIHVGDCVTVMGMTAVTKPLKSNDVYSSGLRVTSTREGKKHLKRLHCIDQLQARLDKLEQNLLDRTIE